MKPKSKRPPLSAHLACGQRHHLLKIQDENVIHSTDPFILSVIEIARKEERSSQVKKEKVQAKKHKQGKRVLMNLPCFRLHIMDSTWHHKHLTCFSPFSQSLSKSKICLIL